MTLKNFKQYLRTNNLLCDEAVHDGKTCLFILHTKSVHESEELNKVISPLLPINFVAIIGTVKSNNVIIICKK